VQSAGILNNAVALRCEQLSQCSQLASCIARALALELDEGPGEDRATARAVGLSCVVIVLVGLPGTGGPGKPRDLATTGGGASPRVSA
jgi:hypothetical protein